MIRPVHPALWIALSIASILSHPCSGMTSGRYVAEKDCLDVKRGRDGVLENGEPGSVDGVDEGIREG